MRWQRLILYFPKIFGGKDQSVYDIHTYMNIIRNAYIQKYKTLVDTYIHTDCVYVCIYRSFSAKEPNNLWLIDTYIHTDNAYIQKYKTLVETYVCVYVYVSVYLVDTYIHVDTYVCVYIYVSVYLVDTYIHVDTYTHTR